MDSQFHVHKAYHLTNYSLWRTQATDGEEEWFYKADLQENIRRDYEI